MLVILDTNVWLKELGLQSPSAAAVRFYMRQKHARLGLPEVIRLEVERNLRERLQSFVDGIADGHRQLLAAFGALRAVVLPTHAEIEAKIRELLRPAGIDVVEVPFTLESARDSYLRTINKIPPSDKDQQFKDGVIWADCVRLLQSDDIALVSADKAFYRDRDYAKGLAPALAAEIANSSNRLSLVASIGELLSELRSTVRIEDESLASEYLGFARTTIDELLERNQFALGERLAISRTLFVTEAAAALFVEFTIRYRVVSVRSGEEREGVLVLKGDGTYDADQKAFANFRQYEADLAFLSDDGAEQHARSVFGYAGGIALGSRLERYTLRHRID